MQFSRPHTHRSTALRGALKGTLLFFLVALAVTGCASGTDGPVFLGGPPLACELDEQPKCLASCKQHLEVMSPVCTDKGQWRCEQGIDSRVCCDVELSPESCPVWANECDSDPPVATSDGPGDGEEVVVEPLVCPDGYTCVNSRTHPIPATRGVCRLGELDVPPQMTECSTGDATAADFLPLLDTGPVKVQGKLVIDTVCDDITCDGQDPCCNECYGSYRLILDGGVEGVEGRAIPIMTESIACMGTNCGITCSPMQPGRRYVIWGTYNPSDLDGDIGQLHHVGHCPL